MALIAEKLTRSASNDDEAQGYRQPPHSIEAEQALLGAVLVNNQAFDRVAGFLEPAHFFDPVHQRIFETAGKLIRAGKQATPITLKTFFENAEPILPDLTVPQYLGTLAGNATTIINAKDYGSTIADLAMRRALIVIGEDMVNEAFDSSIDNPPADQIEKAHARLDKVGDGKRQSRSISIQEAARQSIDRVNEAYATRGGSAGLKTGMASLDAILGGMEPGQLIVGAGPPSMGKTALGVNIAHNVAARGGAVFFVSLEMTAEALGHRVMSRISGLSAIRMTKNPNGDVTEDEVSRWMAAERELASWRFRIEHDGTMSIAALASSARHAKRKGGLDLMVVDYLQLLSGSPNRRDSNRQVEITEISHGLKAIAMSLDIPVIALAQVNRNADHRENKRPKLSDLRESGSIEQDADVVMFPYREVYYVKKDEPDIHDPQRAAWQARIDQLEPLAEVIVEKHRNGPTGTASLGYAKDITTFHDLDEVRA